MSRVRDCFSRICDAKKENGETEKVFAGEVSVRGIYGYV